MKRLLRSPYKLKLKPFFWWGKDLDKKRLSGFFYAYDKLYAKSELSKQGLCNLHVWPALNTKLKVRKESLALMNKQLILLLESKLTLNQALSKLYTSKTQAPMRALLHVLKTEVEKGKTLSETCLLLPYLFSPLYCSYIQMGERTGHLAMALKQINHYQEKTAYLQKKIKKAMAYPVFLILLSLSVTFALTQVLLPQFSSLFFSAQVPLPWITTKLVAFFNLLHVLIPYLALFLMALLLACKLEKHLNELFHYLCLKLSPIGPLFLTHHIVHLSMLLSMTMQAKLPIYEGLEMAQTLSSNQTWNKRLKNILCQIGKGESISSSFSSQQLFPSLFISMIDAGEVSGRLEPIFDILSKHYEQQINDKLEHLSRLIEPVMLCALGIVIGGMVLGIYLPLFKLGEAL